MNKAIIILGFISIILVSGCLGTTPTIDSNNGLLITTFSADPLKVEEGDSVLFLMDVENLGGVTARDIDLDFYGVDGWTGTGKHKDISDMNPPDPITDSPGDFEAITITLTAPEDLPEGVQANFPVTARITFDYKTTATISIPAYSKSLYRIKQNEGEAIDGTAKVENTYAPIQATLSRGSTPIIVDDTKGTGEEDFGYLIEFINVGDGWPISPGAGIRIGALSGTIKLIGNGVTFDECLGQTGGTSVTISEENLDMTTMRSSGRIPIGCSIIIDRTGWGATTSGSVMLTIDMDYRYYVEESTNIMVWGGEADE